MNKLDRLFLRIARMSRWNMRRLAMDGDADERRIARLCLIMDYEGQKRESNGQFGSGKKPGGSNSSGSKSEGSKEAGRSSEKSLQKVAKSCTIKASDGVQVKGYSSHVLDQMKDRGFDEASVEDAIRNPLHITSDKMNESGQPSRQYIGRKATVAVNPENGVICTGWPTGSRMRKKYGGDGNDQ